MVADAFLKIDGCDGESQDDKHANEISVLSFGFGAENSGTAAINFGTGAAKAKVKDIVIRKYLDKASPNLFLFCCTGKPLDPVTLTVRRAGDKPLEYLILTLNTCMISSVQIIGADDTEQVIEEIRINCGKIKYEYHQQDPKTGGSKGAVSTTWDISKSKSG